MQFPLLSGTWTDMATEITKGDLYISDKCGSDQDGDGSKQKPFKTPLKALMAAGKESFPTIYVDSQEEGERWAVISKTQMKNTKKAFSCEQMKNDFKVGPGHHEYLLCILATV